jgi:hypothetical protein
LIKSVQIFLVTLICEDGKHDLTGGKGIGSMAAFSIPENSASWISRIGWCQSNSPADVYGSNKWLGTG